MEIRSARVEDVEHVLPLVERIVALHESWDAARFGAEPGASDMYRGWLRGRCADEESVFLVAERDAGSHVGPGGGSPIAAFLIATVESNLPIYRVDRYGFVHDLWVDPNYRNEGVARSMTMLALERFKRIGVTQVRLDTATRNDAARALFERCGFRTSTTEMLCEL